MRPSKFTKKMLYPTMITLTVTGITWLVSHYFMTVEGEFGPEKHPLEIWSLRLHGLFGLMALICIGMLLEHHILSYFRQKRRLITGLSLAILAAWLAFSGYMLYYLSEDDWRMVFSLAHWILGLLAVAIFCLHLLLKKH